MKFNLDNYKILYFNLFYEYIKYEYRKLEIEEISSINDYVNLKVGFYNHIISTFKGNLSSLNNTKDILFILDFNNVHNFEDRTFENLIVNFDNVAYVNMSKLNPSQIEKTVIRLDDNKANHCVNATNVLKTKRKYFIDSNTLTECFKNYVHKFFTEKNIEIIKSIALFEYEYVESSSVYANPYINIRDLYYDIENYFFIQFQLLCEVMDYIENNKNKTFEIIATSHQGALIANFISNLLGLKTIYVSTIGPKFGIPYNNQITNNISNKNYILISDFICLGTELKIVNALLLIFGSTLSKAFCIANALEIKSETLTERIVSLLNVQNEPFNYDIKLIE